MKKRKNEIINNINNKKQKYSKENIINNKLSDKIRIMISSYLSIYDICVLYTIIDKELYCNINDNKFWMKLCIFRWGDSIKNYFNKIKDNIIDKIKEVYSLEIICEWKYFYYCIIKRNELESFYKINYFMSIPFNQKDFLILRAKEIDYISNFFLFNDINRNIFFNTIQLFDFFLSLNNSYIRSNFHLLSSCTLCISFYTNNKIDNFFKLIPLNIINQYNIKNYVQYIVYANHYKYSSEDVDKFISMLNTIINQYISPPTLHKMIEDYSSINIYQYKNSSLYNCMAYICELIIYEPIYFSIPFPILLCCIIHATYVSYNTIIPFTIPSTIYMKYDISNILDKIFKYFFIIIIIEFQKKAFYLH